MATYWGLLVWHYVWYMRIIELGSKHDYLSLVSNITAKITNYNINITSNHCIIENLQQTISINIMIQYRHKKIKVQKICKKSKKIRKLNAQKTIWFRWRISMARLPNILFEMRSMNSDIRPIVPLSLKIYSKHKNFKISQ